ncbi:MAG: GNAT family N-acetyltransferase, partial [Gammaproteobacteria bacterium]|nr:GNAT family N-acetyltransferase [Gammaproteobacteria bacterium]
MPDLNIVPFEGEYTAFIRAIRDEVFIGEQGIAPEIEFDGQDGSAMHVLVAVD